MKILVRLPNWLGDMVMSLGFLDQLPQFFPGATVSVIAKKGIHQLLPFFPPHAHAFIFDKTESPGIKGLYRFGRKIREQEKFDLFISLPDSFSAALMGYATGSTRRIGYKNEMRSILLTQSFQKPGGLHRVEEYINLLEALTGRKAGPAKVQLQHSFDKKDHVVVNINSEASSRRLTEAKAVAFIDALRKQIDHPIVLIGGPKEQPFVESVLNQLPRKEGISSVAGKTSLPELAAVLAGARLTLTTDSGPAHLSNALGTPTVVLFGAGNENNTAPYEKQWCMTTRLGALTCEPCTKNICVRYGIPQCLERLDTAAIVASSIDFMHGQRL